MRYLLIIAHDDAFLPDEALVPEIRKWNAEMERRAIRVDGNPLRPAREGATVRVRGGRVTRTAGPFSDAAEQMCAYELVECATLDEAVRVASGHPMAKVATIEVRPVWSELAG